MANEERPMKQLMLTRGAVNVIETALLRPGWAKDVRTVYQAGALLDRIDQQFGSDAAPRLVGEDPSVPPPQAEIEAYQRAFKEWADREVELQVADRELKLLVLCIESTAGSGALTPTRHTMRILEVLGLTE